MREPNFDLETAAARRDAGVPSKPFLVPMLRADRDLNLNADPDDREPLPPAVLPNEPVLPLGPAQPVLPRPAASFGQPPVLGSLAVIFGIAALFKATLLLGPLAVIFAFLAVLGRQFSWAAIGGIAGIAALATSPWFWGILGLAWIIDYLGIGSWYSSFL